ncbi:MAG: hypothetical protein ABFC67_08765 [Mizugakiibacter sp.]|uniref:hypothetical protein n=1 Tax=Mizugakiibacter sp. TaxID=1972610 RepID=UPI0031C946F2|nr:hypothetical protein [Xanthomonadaceae bacterium]
MKPAATVPSSADAAFATTRWSLASARSDSAREALNALCLRYRYPVYAYLRRRGQAPNAAQDTTRAFFEQLAHARPGGAEWAARRFREFLFARLCDFLGGGQRAPAEDTQARARGEACAADDPARAFERGFALAVLTRGLRHLRDEASESGHLEMFDALEPYLAREPAVGALEAASARLGARPLALALALCRLRQRFRELCDAELADTVRGAPDLAAERRTLQHALDAEARHAA